VCHISFRQLPALKAHQRTHTEGRTYTCDVCNKLFSHKSVLKGHVLLHRKQHP